MSQQVTRKSESVQNPIALKIPAISGDLRTPHLKKDKIYHCAGLNSSVAIKKKG
jgi:hypothetical protein